MASSNAEELFKKAGDLYAAGDYDEAHAILSQLDAQYPGNVQLLKALARTLDKLGRTEEAIAVCDRLIGQYGYVKALAFRERLAARSRQTADEVVFDSADSDDGIPAAEMAELEAAIEANNAAPRTRRFRIKPVRLAILIALIAGMYFQYVPLWLGVGFIVAYFVIRLAMGKLFVYLFSIPFRMKGRALSGATAELHAVQWAEKPKHAANDDEEESRKGPLRYAWLDVTITPPHRSQGFTHWEPGELMVAPTTTRIRNLDDMDKCFRVHDIKIVADGQETDDEGFKFHGPQRLKMLAEFPPDTSRLKFVYYAESFGDMSLQ